jgi:hypothetical protein
MSVDYEMDEPLKQEEINELILYLLKDSSLSNESRQKIEALFANSDSDSDIEPILDLEDKDDIPKGTMTKIDIFFFKLRNANSMRCIALYEIDGTVIEYSKNKTSQYVFSIKDLFYSRRYSSDFITYNYANETYLMKLFNEKNFMRDLTLPSIKEIIGNEFVTRITEKGIHDYLGHNLLMLNVFILFIAFSDKIATLSMYTPKYEEPSYFYKTDSRDMKDVLSFFNKHKKDILDILLKKLAGKDLSRLDVSDLITQLKNYFMSMSDSDDKASICQNFLEAYESVYKNRLTTVFSNNNLNTFLPDYCDKFTLLVTTMVTLQKKFLKELIPQPQSVKAKEKQIKDNLLKKNETLQKIIEELEKKNAERERQKNERAQRAEKRKRDNDDIKSGGSTKIVLYLVKIEKIRELNKKLRKNKTKNKSKIEKNNKLIDELKVKIKKQKEKEKLKKQKEKKLEKEKLKKQKEKEKLKKQKEKKLEKEKLKKQKK